MAKCVFDLLLATGHALTITPSLAKKLSVQRFAGKAVTALIVQMKPLASQSITIRSYLLDIVQIDVYI